MKISLFLTGMLLSVLSQAKESIQFDCSVNGISGSVLISTADDAGNATIHFLGQALAIKAKDNSAMNMGVMNYNSADKRISITAMSRGLRWDGSMSIDGNERDMSCDYK